MPPHTNVPPPPVFMLDVITLEVKDAKKTHRFLCDVFPPTKPTGTWGSGTGQPFQGSQLSPDGKLVKFKMANTSIQFSTASPTNNSTGDRSVAINVYHREINHVKKVLDKEHRKHNFGEWKAGSELLKWIAFKDDDGYTWNVSEFAKG